ncbi:MAG: hypothetical protein S0880_19665 [Actinomycetota bacterium]|nr:hypothetical protein [Actinomycetota bacterium]
MGRATITRDDWELLRLAPLSVGLGIIAADPAGPEVMEREIDRLRVMLHTTAGADRRDLVHEVAASLVAGSGNDRLPPRWSERDPASARADAAAEAVRVCRRVTEVLHQRASIEEDLAFRRWLYDLARGVARATRKQAFLGLIGGSVVTPAEQHELDALAAALELELDLRSGVVLRV